jgi:hypothetical protein
MHVGYYYCMAAFHSVDRMINSLTEKARSSYQRVPNDSCGIFGINVIIVLGIPYDIL